MTTTDSIVSLEALKRHVRVDDGDDDADLGAKLEAARRHIEAYVGSLDDFADDLPAEIVEAVKQLAAHFYATREAAQEESLSVIPFGVFDLIGPYRKWEF